MADYYPLLARAVAALPENTRQARASIFDRARNALVGQLRRLEPPIAEEEIDRESTALEAAIERLEREFAPPAEEPEPIAAMEPPAADAPEDLPTAQAPASAEEPFTAETPVSAPDAPPAADDAAAPAAADDMTAAHAHAEPASDGDAVEAGGAREPASSGFEPESAARHDANDGAQPAEDAPTADRFGPARRRVGAPTTLQTRPPMFFKARRDRPVVEPARRAPGASLLVTPPFPLGEEAKTPAAPTQADSSPSDDAGLFAGAPASGEALADDEARGAAEAVASQDEPSPDAAAPAARPRGEGQRPVAPIPARVDEAAPRRLWLMGFIVGLVVFLIAIAAYQLRDHPEELQRRAETEAKPVPEPPAAGKRADRIGGAPLETTSPPELAAPPRQPAPAASAPAQSVARRAALLVEAPDEPNKLKTLLGTVVWKVESVNSGPDAPLSDAVRATIDIPEEKLEAIVTLQKNFDASLPASHTMKIQFLGDGGGLGPIQQISAPQMRREDSATGEALAGAPVKITDNTFLVGLSNGEAEAVNVELLRTRGWIDVPILLASGKIAKLTFEKGEAGDKAVSEALDAWKAQ